jgi:magnesium-transporting ATPase (P-type)
MKRKSFLPLIIRIGAILCFCIFAVNTRKSCKYNKGMNKVYRNFGMLMATIYVIMYTIETQAQNKWTKIIIFYILLGITIIAAIFIILLRII